MKKILFATTALVATAGVAAADITLSGYGRFGVSYDDSRAQETEIDQRLRLIITGTAESDNGIGFTAQTRIQWDEGSVDSITPATSAIRAAAFHASYGGLTLSVGNVSASEAQPGFYGFGLGYTGFMFIDPHTIGYHDHDIGLTSDLVTSGGATEGDSPGSTLGAVMVSYGMGDFNIRASYANSGVFERWVLGMDYTFGDYLVALSHQEATGVMDDVTKLYFQGKMGNTTFGLFADDTVYGNSIGVAATTAIGAATTATFIATSLATGGENIGVGINHDLGGGVSFGAGIAQMDSAGGATVAEAGVQFNF